MPAGPLEKGVAMAGRGRGDQGSPGQPSTVPLPSSCRLCGSDNFSAPPFSPKGPSRGLAEVSPPELPRAATRLSCSTPHPRTHAHSPCRLSGARPAPAGVCARRELGLLSVPAGTRLSPDSANRVPRPLPPPSKPSKGSSTIRPPNCVYSQQRVLFY